MKSPLFASNTKASPMRIMGGSSNLALLISSTVRVSRFCAGLDAPTFCTAGIASAFGVSLQRFSMTRGLLLTAAHIDDCARDVGAKTNRADANAKTDKWRVACKIITLILLQR